MRMFQLMHPFSVEVDVNVPQLFARPLSKSVSREAIRQRTEACWLEDDEILAGKYGDVGAACGIGRAITQGYWYALVGRYSPPCLLMMTCDSLQAVMRPSSVQFRVNEGLFILKESASKAPAAYSTVRPAGIGGGGRQFEMPIG